jgi:hypothetical protein
VARTDGTEIAVIGLHRADLDPQNHRRVRVRDTRRVQLVGHVV